MSNPKMSSHYSRLLSKSSKRRRNPTPRRIQTEQSTFSSVIDFSKETPKHINFDTEELKLKLRCLKRAKMNNKNDDGPPKILKVRTYINSAKRRNFI